MKPKTQVKPKTLFISTVVVLLLAFVAAILLVAKKAEPNPALSDESRLMLVRPHSPALGPATAKVELVEFFDPACETCARFYPLVKKLIAESPDQIRLVLRYTPLHNGSDAVVALLEASRLQGKFWPTLETLLATQAAWSPRHAPQMALVWPQLEGLGLDLPRLQRDMESPEVVRRVNQDIDDSRRLGATKTPTFFVNARPLPSFGYEQLETLVREELKKP